MKISEKLDEFLKLCDDGMNCDNAAKAMRLLGIDGYDAEDLASFRLWSDYLPLTEEHPFTEEQRNYHILWEAVDMTLLGMNCDFSVPYRRAIAEKLFKRCGKGFICYDRCRFNLGQNIEIGDYVSINSGAYIDSKGGVEIGDYTMFAENVNIFTHSHGEENHMERTYKKVVIGPYTMLYVNCLILPGVTTGKGSIVAARSVVSHDVPEYTMVAGTPAKEVRKRLIPEGGIENTNHYMLRNRAFQE